MRSCFRMDPTIDFPFAGSPRAVTLVPQFKQHLRLRAFGRIVTLLDMLLMPRCPCRVQCLKRGCGCHVAY